MAKVAVVGLVHQSNAPNFGGGGGGGSKITTTTLKRKILSELRGDQMGCTMKRKNTVELVDESAVSNGGSMSGIFPGPKRCDASKYPRFVDTRVGRFISCQKKQHQDKDSVDVHGLSTVDMDKALRGLATHEHLGAAAKIADSSEPDDAINPMSLHSWIYPQSPVPPSVISALTLSTSVGGQLDFLSERHQMQSVNLNASLSITGKWSDPEVSATEALDKGTRAGYSRADQFYGSYPAGTELLTDTAKLYKAALGNVFEEDEWGPVEWCILAKHFERQGKSPYAYHAQYMAHLASNGQLDGSG
ncbi:putative auxin efflux carrier component 3-like [Capsicum annuum]|nr:putative auxin efflux carrier component 3-like [Capsicum annuum]